MYEYDPKRNERMNRREDMIDKMTDVADKYGRDFTAYHIGL